jgi:hypothetical protein
VLAGERQPQPLHLPGGPVPLAMLSPPKWEAVPQSASAWVTNTFQCLSTWVDQSLGD